eukprot:2500074-Rhodomonas_salina.1
MLIRHAVCGAPVWYRHSLSCYGGAVAHGTVCGTDPAYAAAGCQVACGTERLRMALHRGHSGVDVALVQEYEPPTLPSG